MKKRPEALTKNAASSRNWFPADLLPQDVQLRRRSLAQPTPIQNYDGLKVFYVEEGNGSLIANGRIYPLSAGSCCLLYFFHFHRIAPLPGSTLKISTFYISYNTFLFASIIVGYPLIQMEDSAVPVLVDFPEGQRPHILEIVDSMEEFHGDSGCAMQHALLFELLGRLCRAFGKKQNKPDHKSPPEKRD